MFEYDEADPPGYRSGVGGRGRGRPAAIENVVKLFEVPPGESLCPYHYEYVEEWLLVLDGPVELRGPDGTETLAGRARWSASRAAREGAHKVTNRGERPRGC